VLASALIKQLEHGSETFADSHRARESMSLRPSGEKETEEM
jgi:hypothetical protein